MIVKYGKYYLIWSVIYKYIYYWTVAIIKFQKYQEKMENMQFTKEKVILAISKIKHIQEIIKFSNTNDFENIKKKYVEDMFNLDKINIFKNLS